MTMDSWYGLVIFVGYGVFAYTFGFHLGVMRGRALQALDAGDPTARRGLREED